MLKTTRSYPSLLNKSMLFGTPNARKEISAMAQKPHIFLSSFEIIQILNTKKTLHQPHFAVIGGGSWATAIVKLLLENETQVSWWMRDENAISHIQQYGHNPKYLQAALLDTPKLHLSSNLAQIIQQASHLIIATPAAFIHNLFSTIEPSLLLNKVVISAVKGIIPEKQDIPAHYFHTEFGLPYKQMAIICGPCHAEEVALERLSYLTICSPTPTLATFIAERLACRYVRTTTSDDLIGSEYAAVLKNVYALAAGIYHGLGYGDNFQAVLVSNAIQEMEKFIDEVHPLHRDTKSSAYLGDLLVTAYSNFSRNRTFGFMIGKGYSVQAAQLEMNMIAEGYYAAKSLSAIVSGLHVSLPIVEAVHAVLYQHAPVKSTFEKLTFELR